MLAPLNRLRFESLLRRHKRNGRRQRLDPCGLAPKFRQWQRIDFRFSQVEFSYLAALAFFAVGLLDLRAFCVFRCCGLPAWYKFDMAAVLHKRTDSAVNLLSHFRLAQRYLLHFSMVPPH
jgi:hypothetical protein